MRFNKERPIGKIGIIDLILTLAYSYVMYMGIVGIRSRYSFFIDKNETIYLNAIEAILVAILVSAILISVVYFMRNGIKLITFLLYTIAKEIGLIAILVLLYLGQLRYIIFDQIISYPVPYGIYIIFGYATAFMLLVLVLGFRNPEKVKEIVVDNSTSYISRVTKGRPALVITLALILVVVASGSYYFGRHSGVIAPEKSFADQLLSCHEDFTSIHTKVRDAIPKLIDAKTNNQNAEEPSNKIRQLSSEIKKLIDKVNQLEPPNDKKEINAKYVINLISYDQRINAIEGQLDYIMSGELDSTSASMFVDYLLQDMIDLNKYNRNLDTIAADIKKGIK